MSFLAKPFIKWAGGKSQLISQLEAFLPVDFDKCENITYVEPFVGGGAMLFYMLQAHPNIKKAVINDINTDLMTCYTIIRDNPQALIHSLSDIQEKFYSLEGEDARKSFYLEMRELYNGLSLKSLERATLFIFLNRTCFNGLYRVNKAGKFNVPYGRYAHPLICDKETILADSRILQCVDIMVGDFEQTAFVLNRENNSFFYFDPPYRPLSNTSNFNSYAKDVFDDTSQIRLKKFCDLIQENRIPFMLSNSDSMAIDGKKGFFDNLFAEYNVDRVWAKRNINSIGTKRGKISEILVRNYTSTAYQTINQFTNIKVAL